MHIKANNLTKQFGDKVAVDDITLEMRKGQTLGLLGPNGSGKTTTIRMLTAQLQPNRGQITYDGKPIATIQNVINEYIGIMPQEIIIWDHLTVLENLNYSGKLFGLSTNRLKKRVEYLLDKLYLSGESKKLARNLSGGYKRRLHLAISIIHDPKVIFLDEPTPGIDPQSRRAMWEFLDELKHTQEYSILLTDHYLDEAEKACDYLIIIDEGKIIAQGTMKDLRKEYGDGKFITVDMVETNPKFTKRVKGKFTSAVAFKDKVSIPTQSPEKDIPELLQIIKDESVIFDDISIKEPSLEDIFLLLTGKGVRE